MNGIDIVIRDGILVTPGWVGPGAVSLSDGRIVGLHDPAHVPSATTMLDAGGCYVIPGAVDPHVHFRDPGFTEREDFGTGSAAAVLGGVTTVLDMPNTRPATMDATALASKRDSIVGRSYVDFGLIGAADGSNADALEGLAEAGAAAFKIFMYQHRDPPPAGVINNAVLVDLLGRIAEIGLPAAVHAENDDLVAAGRAAVRGSSGLGWAGHLTSRGHLCEVEAVSRALLFASAVAARLHICHVSSACSVSVIDRARREGTRVSAEVTPQHTLLDSAIYGQFGADALMVPPIREAADRDALMAALIDGRLDMVATDHAPHTAAAKQGDPLEAATGLVGVQWSVPLLFGEVRASRITPTRAVAVLSSRAAEVFGLANCKGALRPGADGDVAVVDPRPRTLHIDELVSKGRSTPFDGYPLAASVRHVLVRGQVQVADGQLVGRPVGRFIAPGSGDRGGD